MVRFAVWAAVLFAMLVMPPPARAVEEQGAEPTGAATVPPDAARDEEQALERAEAEKLRRLRAEQ